MARAVCQTGTLLGCLCISRPLAFCGFEQLTGPGGVGILACVLCRGLIKLKNTIIRQQCHRKTTLAAAAPVNDRRCLC